ncbi:MAG: efflux RND transporter permease subunit [Bryobacteraceae bacterium]|nr:efflux RND transporter permease subunit [Bryobacteraceae bacterium]
MKSLGISGRIARWWIDSPLTPLFIIASVLLGAFSVVMLPREEEPQIVVPMADVFVAFPGATPREVEQRVTRPLEKLIWEITGVEYVYSTSSPGGALVIVRFKVGEDEERSIVRLNQKIQGHMDLIPQGVYPPVVKLRSIDDVPVLALTLSSNRYSGYELRQVAAKLHDLIKQVSDVSEVRILGGQRRELRVTLDDQRMAARGVTALEVMGAISTANHRGEAGRYTGQGREIILEAGQFLRSADDVGGIVAAAPNGKAVYLRDIATVRDEGEEPSQLVEFSDGKSFRPAVTISVAKRKGTNAIDVSKAVLNRVELAKPGLVPAGVEMAITRHYGKTAAEKSNELLFHMSIAVLSVSVLIWLVLGFRESWIVFLAIPVTLALTLAVFYLYGYTLNRITLFALIFSIGILVDDAIVVVENIVRHWREPGNAGRPAAEIAAEAVDEVGNPTILATLTVIAAIMPMAFVGGLMGPYMRPIPVGASSAMFFSLIVAFVVTPWAAIRLLKRDGQAHEVKEDRLTLLYRRFMDHVLATRIRQLGFVGLVGVLLLASCSLVYIQFVQVKMLPFDNKSEFQVIIDMPEGTPLAETARATKLLAEAVQKQPEVVNLQTYVGTASPYNFNGLVRHYYLRSAPNSADIQVNLVDKHERKTSSHEIAKAVRARILPLARSVNANVKVSEVPPGPPVLQTLVAEVYGPDDAGRHRIASEIKRIFETTDGVVDADWYVEDDQQRQTLVIDREKAALHGITQDQIVQTLQVSTRGVPAGLLHVEQAAEDQAITVRLDRAARSDLSRIRGLGLRSRTGAIVSLGELTRTENTLENRSIYHKNLMPVTYVTADVAGAMEAPVYAILAVGPKIAKIAMPGGYEITQYTASQPFDDGKYAMKWDGEWHITYEVFRDLGLAFAVVLVLIYILMVGWFSSFITPIVIMAAIPFSLVGILPAHGLLGAFFTATSMIGFMAGAGIVVRNSIILVDFIELRLKEGMPLREAVVDAGAVRFRPMMLTAAAVVVGSAVILFDPIFQGLAVALMAGEVASLSLSRLTVPVVYYLIHNRGGDKEASKYDAPSVA